MREHVMHHLGFGLEQWLRGLLENEGLNISGTWTGCCRDCCITDRVTGFKNAWEALPSGCCFGATVMRAAKYESKLGAAIGAVTTTTRRSCLTRCTCATTNCDA